MKKNYILLTAVLLFSFNSATRAQHMGGDFMAGMQSTLNHLFTENLEEERFNRLWMLITSDIRMVMVGTTPDTTDIDFVIPNIFAIEYSEILDRGEVYGEFDWENKALSLHITQGAPGGLMSDDNYLSMGFPGGVFEKQYDRSTDAYQYMDLDGYWYIPNSARANRETSSWYIKFHGQTAMRSLTRTMRGLAHVAEEYETQRNQIMAELAARGIISERLGTQLEDTLNSFVTREQLSELGDMPLFIHWAVIYSPETVQQEGNYTATRFTYRGIPNCLKLSGARGKYMIFDNYNRLVFINSGPKGGSVEYFYDRDVTVNLPAANFVSVGNPFNRN